MLVPTAVHAVAAKQDRDSICPPGSVTSGDGTTVQAGPAARAPTALPTAMMMTSDAAAIPFLGPLTAAKSFRPFIEPFSSWP
jgi:hypothetical protein